MTSIQDWYQAAARYQAISDQRRLQRRAPSSLILGTIGMLVLVLTATGFILWALGVFA